MSHSPNAVNRRSLIVRGVGLIAALAGRRLAGEQPHAAAEKKGKKRLTKVQIAQKAQNFADMCSDLGNTPTTDAKPGGVTVSCPDSDGGNGITCTFHSKGTRCHSAAINPGTLPDLQPQNPWSVPGDVPNVPLTPTEPSLRSGRSSRRRSKK